MAASVTADDRFVPIYISSDEDEDVTVLGSSNRAKEIQIQQAILLSMDSSRDPTTIPSSSSVLPFPSGTSRAGTLEDSIPDRKGNRERRLGLPLFPVAPSRSLSKPKTRQVIDIDDDSLLRVIDLDGDDDSVSFVKEIGNGSRKKPRRRSGSSKCPVALCGTLLKPEVINVDDDGDASSSTSVGVMDKGKGKQPCNAMLQEFGQCSSFGGAMIIEDFYCTICMEEVPVIECFPVSGCTHAFCVSCVRQYIAAKVEENVLSIGCPDPGCKDGSFHTEECRDVIPLQLFQRWGAGLCDMALGTLKFYCPFNDCSVLLIDDHRDGDVAITDVECPHCSRMFCAQCKVPWHDGVDCAEFQRLGADERGREDLLLRKVAQQSKWQRCPKCKMYVERADGCVYIVCRCRHRFCYLCGSAMVKGNHHCSKCKRTW